MKSIKIALLAVCSVVVASATAYTSGDVFASINNGLVHEYTNSGTSVQTLNTTLGGFTTGSGFDSAGNFYVTDFGANNVSKFNNNGVLQGTFGSGYGTPEDLLVDSAGNVFVSSLTGGAGLREFNSAGTLLNSFDTANRIDWFDLNSSESVMYYTDEGGSAIHRWNLTTNTALTDLVTADVNNFAIRLLGDGTLLVAATNSVKRINATTGAVVQTYTNFNSQVISELFALNLDPDGTSFWTGDDGTGKLYKINIATGNWIETIDTGVGGGNLFGVSVFGEITQTNSTPEPSSLLLLGSGLASFAFAFRRKLFAS